MTRHWAVCVLAALASAAALAAAPVTQPVLERSHLSVVRPGRMRGLSLARAGTESLKRGEVAAAIGLLERAVAEDPQNVAAWVNLSAARIKSCQRQSALFAALVAGRLDPAEQAATDNLRVAGQMQCPPETPAESPGPRAEWGAYGKPTTPDAWLAAAAARRSEGARALAVLYEDFALESGADRGPALRRIAGDLEALGLLAAGALALDAAGGADDLARAASLRSRWQKLEADARSIGETIAQRAGFQAPEEVAGAVELAANFMALGSNPDQATTELRDLLGVGRPHKVSGSWGELTVEEEWTTVRLPPAPGNPELLLRRFPWDTQLAVFAWPPDPSSVDSLQSLTRRLAEIAGAPAGPLAVCPKVPAGTNCRLAPFDVELSFEGRARLRAYLVGPAEAPPTLLLLGLAGASGCGAACYEAAEQSLENVVESLRLPSKTTPPSASGDAPLRVPAPTAWQADRKHRETDDPWRKMVLGDGFVIDLPPGVVGGVVTGPVTAPEAGRWTRLLFRGAFEDLEGREVSIGDGSCMGWIDVLAGRGADIEQGRQKPALLAPRTDPGAAFVKAAELDKALALSGKASEGLIARFDGQRFKGRWLMIWLRMGEDLVQMALPAATGAGSASLPWMAITLRREEDEPPPPPVDLTARYQVHFLRATARDSRTDPREGTLEAAELQLAVPKGCRVSLNSNSRDGFPVTLRCSDGSVVVAERLSAAGSADLAARQRQVEALCGTPREAWGAVRRLRDAAQSEAEFAAAKPGEGERVLILVVPDQPGDAPAFRLTLTRGRDVAEEVWRLMRRLVGQSLRVRAPSK